MGRWDAVRAWRDRLRALDPGTLGTGLSPEGAREAMNAALDALTDQALADAAALPVVPAPRAAVIPASTVFTAPIEWCAVLLGRGSEVLVKRPRARAALVDALVDAAEAVGLPLSATSSRDLTDANLVVAMGSDDTLRAIRQGLPPGVRFAGHGSAWSLAWLTGDGRGLARDLALHEGRGCLSPVVVFTPLPLDRAVGRVVAALEEAQARWPLGEVSPGEAARIRARGALARVVGSARVVEGGAVHGLPAERFVPEALPRAPAVVQVADLAEAVELVGRWPGLSTVGTDAPDSAHTWRAAGASRVCPLGEMQRPPLRRLHDGVDWVRDETGLGPWRLPLESGEAPLG